MQNGMSALEEKWQQQSLRCTKFVAAARTAVFLVKQ